MSKPPKIDRKSLKQADLFQKDGIAVLDWLASKKSTVVPFLVVAIVAIVSVYGFEWWSEREAETGWRQYHEAMKKDEPARWDELKKMAGIKVGNRPTYFAAIALADHFFDEAKKEYFANPNSAPASAMTAVEWYDKALVFSELIVAEKQLVLINRGNALETAQKYDDAINGYQSAIQLGGDLKPLALLNLGRVYELKNDKAKATEAYQKITQEFEKTEYSKQARNYLRRLKSGIFQTSQG